MDNREFIEEFCATVQKMLKTAEEKNSDYTGGEGAFENFMLGEKIGIGPTDHGILWRMTDKLARVIALTKVEAQVKDEAIEDTLLDLANYAIILLLWYKHRNATFAKTQASLSQKMVSKPPA